MQTHRFTHNAVAFAVMTLLLSTLATSAQEDSAAAAAAQANNPLANMTAFNLHNYYIGELTDPDKDAGWPEWQIFIGINTQFK